MAAEQIKNPMIYETNVQGHDEIKDRGVLNFLEKKGGGNKPHVKLSVPAETHVLKSEEEENTPASFTEKLHRSNNSSSSIDEEGEGGNKKSEGLKDKIKEKIGGEKEQEKNAEHDQVIGKGVTRPGGPGRADDQVIGKGVTRPKEAEDKKGGFDEKIKEKLPGTHKTDEHEQLGSADMGVTRPGGPGRAEDKKGGSVEKIKEKLPAGTHKTDEHEELVYADMESPKETENKKGLMGKIKEKLPGGTNKTNEVAPKYDPTEANKHKEELEGEKGPVENIKEKLPGKKPVEREDGTYY